MKIHLSDPDNRDDRGASFEFTGSVAKVIKYLDGPLRRDVKKDGIEEVDAAIAALHAGDFDKARDAARRCGVYLTKKKTP